MVDERVRLQTLRYVGVDDGRRRGVPGEEAFVLGPRHRQYRAVPCAGRQRELRAGCPLPGARIGGLEGHVAAPAELVDEQVPPAVVRVGAEDDRSLALLDRPVPDPVGHEVVRGGAQLLRLLHGDELAAGRGGGVAALVLGEAVVGAVVADDGRVDHRVAGVVPQPGFAEDTEVAGGRVQHPVVGVGAVVRVVRRVQPRRPEDDELAPLRVVNGLGRPDVAGGVRGDAHPSTVGPVHQIGALPDHEGGAPGALHPVPVAVRLPVHPEVGGDQVEAVTLRGAHEEGIAQPARAEVRSEHRRPAVQLAPAQWVVPPAEREPDPLTVRSALAGEVDEDVSGVLLQADLQSCDLLRLPVRKLRRRVLLSVSGGVNRLKVRGRHRKVSARRYAPARQPSSRRIRSASQVRGQVEHASAGRIV